MESIIKTYKREDDEIQNVQVVTLGSFDDLDFVKPDITPSALKHVALIYRDFFIKEAPCFYMYSVVDGR